MVVGSATPPRERRASLGSRIRRRGCLDGAPEGTNRATSVSVQLLCLQKDLRTGSISRDSPLALKFSGGLV